MNAIIKSMYCPPISHTGVSEPLSICTGPEFQTVPITMSCTSHKTLYLLK